jgi:hypothetical protein
VTTAPKPVPAAMKAQDTAAAHPIPECEGVHNVRHWPVLPSFLHGGLNYGDLTPARGGR